MVVQVDEVTTIEDMMIHITGEFEATIDMVEICEMTTGMVDVCEMMIRTVGGRKMTMHMVGGHETAIGMVAVREMAIRMAGPCKMTTCIANEGEIMTRILEVGEMTTVIAGVDEIAPGAQRHLRAITLVGLVIENVAILVQDLEEREIRGVHQGTRWVEIVLLAGLQHKTGALMTITMTMTTTIKKTYM